MKIVCIVGHVAKDVKEGTADDDRVQYVPGGGVFYGAIALARILEGRAVIKVVTKCHADDKYLFTGPFEEAGITDVTWLPSRTTTTFHNAYSSGDPSKRVSRLLEAAEPFTMDELSELRGDYCIVTPLWNGELGEAILRMFHDNKMFTTVVVDAQGFTRCVDKSKYVSQCPWVMLGEYKDYIHVLKADNVEIVTLLGEDHGDWEENAKALSARGLTLLGTSKDEALLASKGAILCKKKFEPYSIEARTGRGDTMTASFVAFLVLGHSSLTALELASRITSFKLQTPGPLKRLPESLHWPSPDDSE